MVLADPTVDITQQLLSLFDGDAALQDPGMASLVQLPLDNDKGLGATCESSGLRLVRGEYLAKEVIRVSRPPVRQRVGLCC